MYNLSDNGGILAEKNWGDPEFLKTVVNFIYLDHRNYRTKGPKRDSLNGPRKTSSQS